MPNVDATYRELTARGVRFVEPPHLDSIVWRKKAFFLMDSTLSLPVRLRVLLS